jgi:hypothetical protein
MYFIPSTDELVKELKATILKEENKLNKLEADKYTTNCSREIAETKGRLFAFRKSLAMVEAFIQEQQIEEPSLAQVDEDTKEYLPLGTKFVWGQDTYPKEDCEVYLKLEGGYYLVEPIRTNSGKVNTVKIIRSQKYVKLKELEEICFLGNPYPPEETVVKEMPESILTAKLDKDPLDREVLRINGEDKRLGGRQKIELPLDQMNLNDITYLINQLQAIRTELESR